MLSHGHEPLEADASTTCLPMASRPALCAQANTGFVNKANPSLDRSGGIKKPRTAAFPLRSAIFKDRLNVNSSTQSIRRIRKQSPV